MTYYQLLRKRRLDLKLSIQDVSSQTRLAPEYIKAIEEHNLDVFSDDFSFVRYFVHAYCDAIGVNWAVVQEEVDEDIHAYARMRNQALTQAQRRMASSMKPATKASKNKGKKKKKNRSTLGKIVAFISYKLLGTKSSKYKRLITLGIVALIVLFAVNIISDRISASQKSAYEQEQQEEYDAKEKETEELAKQYQSTKEKKAMKVECESTSDNVWLLSNIESGDCDIQFEITLPESSIVNLYKDDSLVSDGENTVYTGTFSKKITVTGNCVLQLQIGTYSDDVVINVGGKKISYHKPDDWYDGEWAVIYFKVQYNGTDEPEIKSDESEDEEDESEDEYYDDEEYYEDYTYDEEAGTYY